MVLARLKTTLSKASKTVSKTQFIVRIVISNAIMLNFQQRKTDKESDRKDKPYDEEASAFYNPLHPLLDPQTTHINPISRPVIISETIVTTTF